MYAPAISQYPNASSGAQAHDARPRVSTTPPHVSHTKACAAISWPGATCATAYHQSGLTAAATATTSAKVPR